VEEESDEDGAEGEQLSEADEGAAGGGGPVGAGEAVRRRRPASSG
jgi:hypothetical protein